ncbi:MAG: metallophosphoesterase [Candidatus Bathyarchaeota archaeon]|jgi:DNA repair exonuclease SbcCD nuclease subunit
MKPGITILSDTHLGLERKAHTTAKSRAALKQRLFQHTYDCSAEAESVVHVGDLFNSFSNSEDDILKACDAAIHCDVVLFGNHDSVNQSDNCGSFDVASHLMRSTSFVKPEEFGNPYVEYGVLEGVTKELAFIPHQANQDLFDESIRLVADSGKDLRAVFLHCNYENEMAVESDTALNLTKVQALKLLKVSDYIFMGHEHQPRELLDGRLIITGCIHPTSFSDISDKFVWHLTDDSLGKEKVWDMVYGYTEIDFSKPAQKMPEAAEFIDIVGTVPADRGAELAKFIADCWEQGSPLMIRNNVTIKLDSQSSVEAVDFENLPKIIGKELEGTDMQALWEKYGKKANA